jgi:hypothetical protein
MNHIAKIACRVRLKRTYIPQANIVVYLRCSSEAVTTAADQRGNWCEGCGLHEHLLHDPSGTASGNARKYVAACRGSGCPWAGRRGPELAARGVAFLVNGMLADASSDLDLAIWYRNASADSALEVRLFFNGMLQRLVSQIDDKLGFWECLPFSLLGVFWKDHAAAKHCCKLLIDEHQLVVDSSTDHKLHRVARRFLDADSPFRAQLISFATSDLPLSAYPELYIEIRSYAMISIVSRKVEGVHSHAKRFLKTSENGMVPACSTFLNRPSLRPLLQDWHFLQWLRQQWGTRSWLKNILRGGLHRTEQWRLKVTKRKLMLRMFYQSDLQAQYRCLDQEHQLTRAWKRRCLVWEKCPVVLRTEVDMLWLHYLRSVLQRPDLVWSFPSALLSCERPVEPLSGLIDSLSQLVGAASPPVAIEGDFVDTHTFFQVCRADPDAKKVVWPSHLEHDRTNFVVAIFKHARILNGKVCLEDSSIAVQQLSVLQVASVVHAQSLVAWSIGSCSTFFSLSARGEAALGAVELEANAGAVDFAADDGIVVNVAPPGSRFATPCLHVWVGQL